MASARLGYAEGVRLHPQGHRAAEAGSVGLSSRSGYYKHFLERGAGESGHCGGKNAAAGRRGYENHCQAAQRCDRRRNKDATARLVGRGRACPVDCLRQRRQPAACARRLAHEGACASFRAGGYAGARHPATADRKPAVSAHRRRYGRWDRVVGRERCCGSCRRSNKCLAWRK